MATVTGLTKARMLAMEAATVISGAVSGDNLILTKRDGSTINAGNVRGPIGPAGSLTGPAGGDLTGNYPNPTVGPLAVNTSKLAVGAVTDPKVAAANKDGLPAVPCMRTLGSGAQQAAAGDHTHAEAASVFMNRTVAVAQGISASTFTRILLPDGPLEGFTYDAATGIFTAVTPGVYTLSPMIAFAAAAAARRILLIYVNGSETYRQENAASTTIHGMSFSVPHRFVAGDTFEMRGWHNTTGTVNTSITAGQVRFGAVRTGP